ncbi:unnamed protein product, partial [Iphiclides podalirius]
MNNTMYAIQMQSEPFERRSYPNFFIFIILAVVLVKANCKLSDNASPQDGRLLFVRKWHRSRTRWCKPQ